jgi:predicted AAA+ superfamily ATPase
MPFSLAEFRQINEKVSLGQLMLRSGFPETFLADDDLEASRWRQQYVNGLLTTDVFDLEPNFQGDSLVYFRS